MFGLYQKRIKMSIDYDTFFGTFLRNKNADFMGFTKARKKCTKNECFWHTKYEWILLACIADWMANVIITFYSSSQTAAQKAVSLIKRIGGAYYIIYLISLFGLPYVGCICSSMDFWNLPKSWLPKSIIRLLFNWKPPCLTYSA